MPEIMQFVPILIVGFAGSLALTPLSRQIAMRLGVVADDNGNVAEYGMATAVDSDTGERVAAGTMTAADAATGDVVSVGAAVDADPTTGEVTAGEYVATGNLADTDDDADASASDESDTGTPDATAP